MTLDKTHLLLLAAALLLIVIVGGLALVEHDRSIRLQAANDATQAANAIVIKQANDKVDAIQKQVDALTKASQQLEADKAALQAQINQKYAQAKTPQQQAAVTAQNLGVPAEQVKATPTEITTPAPQLMAYQQACETCTLNLKVSTQQLGYSEQIRQQQVDQLSAKDQKIGALQKDLDSANNAAKGGTKWQRIRHDGKFLAIGGAVAIVVACALGHCPK